MCGRYELFYNDDNYEMNKIIELAKKKLLLSPLNQKKFSLPQMFPSLLRPKTKSNPNSLYGGSQDFKRRS